MLFFQTFNLAMTPPPPQINISSTAVSNIDNKSSYSNNICRTMHWSYDAENLALNHGNLYFIKIVIIFHNIRLQFFFFIFDQINAGLMSI